MTWTTLFENLGVFGLIIAASTYIIKQFIKYSFSKDLEKYKSELQIEAISFKTTFENLHLQRAEVIKTVYEKIVTTQIDFESLIRPFQATGEPNEEEKVKKAAQSYESLQNYFHKNKIYFNKELAEQLQTLLSKFLEVWRSFNKPRVDTHGNIHRDLDAWDRAWQKLNKDDIPPFLSKIELEFRKILGIDN